MKKYFPLILFLLSLYGAFAQTYTVGVQSVTWTDASRSNRSVPVEFHYPGTNSAIAPDSFGFVVFGHGFDMTIDAYYNYADSLAAHGYIVALTSNEGGLSPTHANLAQDLIYIYNNMISQSNTTASSLLYHHVKPRGAISGHSMGGGCTVLSCQYSDTATCYWTLAEATTNPSSVTAAPFMRKPYLSFAGGNDCIAPASTNQKPTYDSCGSICKTLIEIKNATHCQFALSNIACNFGEGVSGCASTPLSRTAQTNAVLYFLLPYLDYYLNGNCSAWTLFESRYTADVTDTIMQNCHNVIPANQAITGATSFCNGSLDTLTANPAGFSYMWSNSSIAAHISISNPGSYTLTVSNGTCAVTATPFTVTQKFPPATPGAISSPDTVCSGIASIGISVNNDTTATTYNWTLPSGWSINSGNNTHAITGISGSTGGTISVTAQNSCGTSSSVQKNIVVNLSGLAAPGAIRGDTLLCAGQPVQYVIDSVNGASSYVWNYPVGWTLNSTNHSDTLNLTSGSGSGTVTVQAVNGCGQGLPSILNVHSNAVPIIGSMVGDTVVCVGQSVHYVVTPVGVVTTYTWNYPNGWTLISGGNSDSINLTTSANPGSITVQVENGCGQSTPSSLNVTTKTAPTIGSITGLDSVCINSTGSLAFTLQNVVGADSILWVLPNGWDIISGQGTTHLTTSHNQSGGAINVTAYNLCGSTGAVPVNVNVTDTPQPVVTQINDTLTTGAANGYQWYLNGGPINGATSQNYITTQNGNYSVAVTNTGGCTGTSSVYNYVYLSLNNLPGKEGVNFFPNPSANGLFQVCVTPEMLGSKLEVFDVLARKVMEHEINDLRSTIDMSGFNKGIYLANLTLNGTSCTFNSFCLILVLLP